MSYDQTYYIVYLLDEDNQRLGGYSVPWGYPLPAVGDGLVHGDTQYRVTIRSFNPKERVVFLQCKNA